MDEYRGSEWRKWDLHIHTPGTKLNDNYKPIGTENIWETFCSKLNASDVSAFGITDYFSVENYKNFLIENNNYFPKSNKVFFPNIEFRLDVSVNKRAEEVNIHVIFSNEIEINKIEDFLIGLKTNITRKGAPISCKSLQNGIAKTVIFI